MTDTVKSLWDMCCPKCGKDTGIEIDAVESLVIRLVNDGTEQVQGGDTEWTDTSFCKCAECDYHGEVKDFKINLDGDTP